MLVFVDIVLLVAASIDIRDILNGSVKVAEYTFYSGGNMNKFASNHPVCTIKLVLISKNW